MSENKEKYTTTVRVLRSNDPNIGIDTDYVFNYDSAISDEGIHAERIVSDKAVDLYVRPSEGGEFRITTSGDEANYRPVRAAEYLKER